MVVKKVNIFLEIRTTQSQKDRREIQQLALTKFLLIFEFPLANNQWLDANRSKKKIAKIDVCQKQFNKSIEIRKVNLRKSDESTTNCIKQVFFDRILSQQQVARRQMIRKQKYQNQWLS